MSTSSEPDLTPPSKGAPAGVEPARSPLAGLKVLELADGIAGPYAGRLLAMLGATVVKVEPPGGDPTRRKPIYDVPLAPDQTSPLYLHVNARSNS